MAQTMADASFGLVLITITLPTVMYIIYYNIYTINKVSIQRKKEKKKKLTLWLKQCQMRHLGLFRSPLPFLLCML